MKKTFVVIAVLLSIPLAAQLEQGALIVRMDSLVEMYQNSAHCAGVVLVAKSDQLLYHHAFGLADRDRKIPNKMATNFNIASVGKIFTATLIMQLVEAGQIDLDKPLNFYLPEYPIKNADRILVRQLLTHTSGVGNYMMHPDFEARRAQLKSLDEMMTLVVEMPPTLKFPGEQFDYSNSGFIILGKIIEKITGKEYFQVLSEKIFRIAGMDNSYFHYPATFNPPAEAVPYYVFGSNTFVNAEADEFPGFSDGGLQTNAIDLWRYCRALLSGLLIQSASLRQMWEPQVEEKRGMYAFGWENLTTGWGQPWVGHGGGGHGFSSCIGLVPEEGYIVIVLLNQRYNPLAFCENILAQLAGRKMEPLRPYFSEKVFSILETKGFEEVKDKFPEWMRNGLEGDKPQSRDVYQLLDGFQELGRFGEGLALADMARRQYPNDTVLLIISGGFFEGLGDIQRAEQYYRAALEKDPNNPFAAQKLARIEN